MRFIPYICDFPQFSPSVKIPSHQGKTARLSDLNVQSERVTRRSHCSIRLKFYTNEEIDEGIIPPHWHRFPQTTLLYSKRIRSAKCRFAKVRTARGQALPRKAFHQATSPVSIPLSYGDRSKEVRTTTSVHILPSIAGLAPRSTPSERLSIILISLDDSPSSLGLLLLCRLSLHLGNASTTLPPFVEVL